MTIASYDEKNFADLENKIGTSFKNKDNLVQALVHRSYLNENRDFPLAHNERLEFLENTIEFFIENNQLIADLCFELSRDFECHQYSLNISNKSMKTLINELDFYLDKFPERK